jgi:hypothetical protein
MDGGKEGRGGRKEIKKNRKEKEKPTYVYRYCKN